MLKIRSLFIVCASLMTFGANALELRGAAPISITSDTAANAKSIAMNEARRQILVDSLRQYADVESLITVVQNARSADLVDLVSSSSISGEQLSDTTYSANITMVLNDLMVKDWLDENQVQNWMPVGVSKDRFIMVVTLSDKLADWAQLQEIARAEKIDLETQNILGNRITVQMPVSKRADFTIAVNEGGWRYNDRGGALHLWK